MATSAHEIHSRYALCGGLRNIFAAHSKRPTDLLESDKVELSRKPKSSPKVLLDLQGTPAQPRQSRPSLLPLGSSAQSLHIECAPSGRIDQAWPCASSEASVAFYAVTQRAVCNSGRAKRRSTASVSRQHTVQPSHNCTSFAPERVAVKPAGAVEGLTAARSGATNCMRWLDEPSTMYGARSPRRAG